MKNIQCLHCCRDITLLDISEDNLVMSECTNLSNNHSKEESLKQYLLNRAATNPNLNGEACLTSAINVLHALQKECLNG